VRSPSNRMLSSTRSIRPTVAGALQPHQPGALRGVVAGPDERHLRSNPGIWHLMHRLGSCATNNFPALRGAGAAAPRCFCPKKRKTWSNVEGPGLMGNGPQVATDHIDRGHRLVSRSIWTDTDFQ